MRVTMSTTSGRACRGNCIRQGHFFCATEKLDGGVCCDVAEESCRLGSGLCSFDMAS